jgi:hypothetical protein
MGRAVDGWWIEADPAGHADPNAAAGHVVHPDVCAQQHGGKQRIPCGFFCWFIMASRSAAETARPKASRIIGLSRVARVDRGRIDDGRKFSAP